MNHVQVGSSIERGDSNRPCPLPDRNWQRGRCCRRCQCRRRSYRTRFRSIAIRDGTYYELRQRHRDERRRCDRCIAGMRAVQRSCCCSSPSLAPTPITGESRAVTEIHQTQFRFTRTIVPFGRDLERFCLSILFHRFHRSSEQYR